MKHLFLLTDLLLGAKFRIPGKSSIVFTKVNDKEELYKYNEAADIFDIIQINAHDENGIRYAIPPFMNVEKV